MSEPGRDEATPPTAAEPTMEVGPPPVPGRAVRDQLARGELATPPIRPDEPTVTLHGAAPQEPDRTLELDSTLRAGVAVGPRPGRPRRTWPWIVAVVIALLVLGAVLLVMLWRGATIDGDVDLIGWSGGWTGPGGG